jgi:hypothetical protein
MKKFLIVSGAIAFSILLVFIVGYAVISARAIEANIEVKVTVLPLYNISMSSNIQNRIIYPNENLNINLRLNKKNLTKLSEKINVSLDYEFYKGKKLIKKGLVKNILLNDKTFTGTINIKIPSEFRDFYDLKLIATSPQASTAETKEMFYVRRRFFGF